MKKVIRLFINKAQQKVQENYMSQPDNSNIQPHILARYTIIKKIGSGAYGHVWKVQEKITKKIFALKKIFDAFQHSTDAQRTYREIQVLRQIDHPNIIKLYQTFKAENNKDVYLIFEFMEADLHNVIAEGILKEVHIRFIIYQLAKALKYLHSGSIIHRDLKPSNILINSNCTIKLCDFGLVRSFAALKQGTPILTEGVATRWYRAPEVLLGSTSYSTPADVWSFGCIIYEILAQKPMFPGENTGDQINKIVAYSGFPTQQQIKSLKSDVVKSMLKQSKLLNCTSNQKQLLKDIPPIFAQLIRKMTIFNPSQRITIQEILCSEVVQPFRKKQQQIQCNKIITTEINDNKKLTVDEYRKLIYGVKRSNSTSGTQIKMPLNIAKKSSSHTRLGTQTQPNETSYEVGQREKEKIGLKYVRSKDNLKTISYNKSTGEIKTVNELHKNLLQEKKAQQKAVDSRKDLLKDPTRITYITKNSYTPKYGDTKPYPSINQSYSSSNAYNILTQAHNSNYVGLNNSISVMNSGAGLSKVGFSYTSSSAYTNQKKPMLFKSSKYVTTKTEECHKD